jgi:hypothetical protein
MTHGKWEVRLPEGNLVADGAPAKAWPKQS